MSLATWGGMKLGAIGGGCDAPGNGTDIGAGAAGGGDGV